MTAVAVGDAANILLHQHLPRLDKLIIQGETIFCRAADGSMLAAEVADYVGPLQAEATGVWRQMLPLVKALYYAKVKGGNADEVLMLLRTKYAEAANTNPDYVIAIEVAA